MVQELFSMSIERDKISGLAKIQNYNDQDTSRIYDYACLLDQVFNSDESGFIVMHTFNFFMFWSSVSIWI